MPSLKFVCRIVVCSVCSGVVSALPVRAFSVRTTRPTSIVPWAHLDPVKGNIQPLCFPVAMVITCYHPNHHPNHDAAWSVDVWFTQEGQQGPCKRTRCSSSGGAGSSSCLIRCCPGTLRMETAGDRFPDNARYFQAIG